MDSMIPMRSAEWKKYALKYEPGHQQHGWIFYDNFGTWVTLRKATPEEMENAALIHSINASLQAPGQRGEG